MKAHRWIAALAITIAFVAGCEDGPKPAAPKTSAKAKASVKALATASTNKASAPVAAKPASLESLPKGAMVYGSGDLSLFDVAFGMAPPKDKEQSSAMLAEMLGAKVDSSGALSKALGLDPARPILFGMVGPPAAGIEKVVEAFVGYSKEEQRAEAHKQLAALEPPLHSYARLIMPLAGDDASKLFAGAEKLMRGKAEPCATSAKCKLFDGKPHTLLVGKKMVAAAYLAAKYLTVDLVIVADGDPGSDKVLKALNAFHGNHGGPGTINGAGARCSGVGSGNGMSLCMVPELAAEAGVAAGLLATLGAVSAKSIDVKQAVEIAKIGREESLQNRAILNLKPKVLDDGTLALSGTAQALVIKASWSVNAEGDKLLAKSFGSEQCATGGVELVGLLEKLRDAFGVEAKFDPKLLQQFQEAGWGAFPVAAGGAWPSFIPFMIENAKKMPEAFGGKTCILSKDKRLTISATQDLTKMLVK